MKKQQSPSRVVRHFRGDKRRQARGLEVNFTQILSFSCRFWVIFVIVLNIFHSPPLPFYSNPPLFMISSPPPSPVIAPPLQLGTVE